MKKTQVISAAAITLALVAATSLSAQATPERFTWSGVMQPGTTFELRNISGSVRVERASGREVSVVGEKRFTRGDPATVKIEAIRTGSNQENVLVCGLWGANARCAAGGGGSSSTGGGDGGGDVSVHFTIRLPDGVKANLNTINGGIDVTGAGAQVVASTINGSISVTGSGAVTASTVTGSVEARITSASGSDNIELRSVNGSISATVPAGINALFRANTVNGGIQSDFPVTVEGNFGPRSASATLGSGGRNLRLSTVNGSVTLKRG